MMDSTLASYAEDPGFKSWQKNKHAEFFVFLHPTR
jgi:hypothetical protein